MANEEREHGDRGTDSFPQQPRSNTDMALPIQVGNFGSGTMSWEDLQARIDPITHHPSFRSAFERSLGDLKDLTDSYRRR